MSLYHQKFSPPSFNTVVMAEAPVAQQLPVGIEDLDSLTILSHPLVAVKMTELRDKSTQAYRFRTLIGEVTTLLGMEASR